MIRLKKRFTWLTTAGLLALLLVTSLSITPARADVTPPPLPGQTHQFYGLAFVNGAAASPSTYIYASVDGGVTVAATTQVASQGIYGYSPLFEVPGSNGQTVTFKVGTTSAPQSAIFQAGASTRLDLSVITTSLAVSTGTATSFGSRTATLNGNLSNMGGFSSVTVSFIYGTTPPHGSTAVAGVPPSLTSSPAAFTASLTGLTPNTTYYFVAVATSGSTTVYGTPLQFTTTLPILAVATNAATPVAANGATLNGNLTDRGNNTSVYVYFQYGTTPSYGTGTTPRLKSAAGIFNEPITGLLSGTPYHFRAVAEGSNPVENKYGDDLTFTTLVGSLSVTTGNAASISCNSALLNGTLTGLGGASSASIYFQYGLSTTYTVTTLTQPGTTLGSFSTAISGLAPSTIYHFKAFATTSGTPVSGSDATFTTPACTGGSSLTPPHQFWGRVYVNGILASSNIPVAAYVNDVPAASTTTDSAGRYGWTTLFYVPGSSGTVTFYVNSILVPQTAAYSSGGMTNLNLYSTGPGVLTITCPQSTGQVGTSYSSSIGVTGGTSSYTCSITSGSLPPGLTRTNCAISGLPTTNGTYPFTVQVTDSASPANTGTKSCSITIGTSPPPSGDGGQLIGASDATINRALSANYISLTRFQAVASGNIATFKVKSDRSANVKVAIYTDSSGSPGALLNAVNTDTAIVAGWNSISIASTAVNSGTYYWLAINSDTFINCATTSTGGTIRAKAAPHAAFTFPDSAGTGYTSASGIIALLAGWDVETAAEAPAAPTRDCSALTFKWNTATGATKYHLQVNTSSGFTGTDMFNAEVGNVLFSEVTGLTAGTTYYWRVKAGNAAGWSDWSTPTGNMRCE